MDSFYEGTLDISTHILTRRMTCANLYIFTTIIISTHILTRRMTCKFGIDYSAKCISTHILTRRMTGGNRNEV